MAQRRNGERWLVMWINDDGITTTETMEAGVCPCLHCWCGNFSQAVKVAKAELAKVWTSIMASTSTLEALPHAGTLLSGTSNPTIRACGQKREIAGLPSPLESRNISDILNGPIPCDITMSDDSSLPAPVTNAATSTSAPARRNSITQTDRIGTPSQSALTKASATVNLSSSVQQYFKYACPEVGCGRKYPQRANLKRHLKSFHRGLEASGASSEGGSFLSARSVASPVNEAANGSRAPGRSRNPGTPTTTFIGLPNASILRPRGAMSASSKKIVHFKSPPPSSSSEEPSITICGIVSPQTGNSSLRTRSAKKKASSKATSSGARPYKCDLCSKSFTDSSSLTAHKRVHSGERPYKCDQCSKSFIQLIHLSRHKQFHSGEVLYKCDQCTKSFTHSGHLKDHKRVHSRGGNASIFEETGNATATTVDDESGINRSAADKPYKCTKCEKSYVSAKGLAVHIRKHGAPKIFACLHCEKSFASNTSLKRHERSHSRAKKSYECRLCLKHFIAQEFLDVHFRNEHPTSDSSLEEQETVVIRSVPEA